jgi:hypothetical protein
MTGTIVVALVITSSIFICTEVIYKHLKRKNALSNEVIKEMKETGMDFDNAKENVLTKKIAKAMKIDSERLELDNNIIVKQGDRVSFNTLKYGYITGEFIGTKKSQAEGYGDILIVRFGEGKILQAPLEYICKDTIIVYER